MKSIWTAITFAFLMAAVLATSALFRASTTVPGSAHIQTSDPAPTTMAGGVGWFQQMRPYCNPVEAETRMSWTPFPDTQDGQSHAAACWALAGEIDKARALISALPQDQQWQAASVVFNIGHPVADAGNDVAAGPLMELVVEFWPNNYMALYHAGASRYARGDEAGATAYLERFLEEYHQNDGWTRNARQMLGL